MNVYLPNSRLPSAYQEVEYIQSSGTQYIDTLFTPNSTSKVVFKISNFTINSSTQYIYCTYSTRGNNMFALVGNSNWDGGTNGLLCFRTTYPLTSGNLGNGGTHTGEVSSGGFYLDGTKLASVSGTFSGVYSLTLFAGHGNGKIGFDKGSFKLYYFQIYESGTLVRDFVPCYRKSDNVIGLYDLVNNQFYTNAGTGTFSKGSDVTMAELKNAYIGEYTEITETYTFNKTGSSSYSDQYNNIYKTGYNISKVSMIGTLPTGSGRTNTWISYSQSQGNPNLGLVGSLGSNQELRIYKQDGTYTTLGTVQMGSASTISFTAEFSIESYKVSIGSNNISGNFTAEQQAIIKSIFESGLTALGQSTNNASYNNQTITVYYYTA